MHLDRIEQRHHLSTLIPMSWRDAVRQGHAAPLGETVDEDPLAFPPVRDALAAPLPRGKKRHRRRHTPNASSPVPRQSRESALASRPACHPPASAATSAAWRSSTPIAAHAGHHTSDSRQSKHRARYSIFYGKAHGASHGRVAVGPAERCPRTSATLNHLRLQIVLPYCPPISMENSIA
jgi:hypothetical protein